MHGTPPLVSLHLHKKMGDDAMIKIGPAGRSIDGKAWDEKGRTKIAQIFVSHNNRTIHSIQFQYAENGRLKLSEKHGSSVGSRFDAVKLKPATEHITWISGRWGSTFNFKEDYGLCSITFGTKHGEYGPFGTFTANDREFCFNLGEGGKDDPPRFGGFYKLNSIGLYLNPNVDVALEDQKPINTPRNK